MLVATNPATGEIVREVPLDDPASVEAKLAAARAAAGPWGLATFDERAEVLRRVAAVLRDERDRWAALMVEEVGKPITQAHGEIDKTVWATEHYAAHAERYLAADPVVCDAAEAFVQYLPIGPVLGILPWNSPFWLAARVFAPALMAGNPVLIKHDPHCPGCALGLVEVFERAEAPPGLLQALLLDTEGTRRVLDDERIAGVSLTGSTRAGRAVGRQAGERLLPVVLELGGSDPAIVLPDADLDDAVACITTSRMIMAGQSCVASKRLLVHDEVHDAFVDKLTERISAMRQGDPTDPATDIGPLARRDLRDELHAQVQASVDAGARCVLGGAVPDGPGAFYPPTLLVDATPDMRVCTEETFGPVAVVRRVGSVAEALAEANATAYGLAASVWTADVDLARDLARRLEAGQVAINGIVKTDPRLPSGGIKASGLGRELGSHGIHEFVNAQQVWIGPKTGEDPRP